MNVPRWAAIIAVVFTGLQGAIVLGVVYVAWHFLMKWW